MKLSLLPCLIGLLSVLGGSDGQLATPQTCAAYAFPGNKAFKTCIDLPVLSSYLHWTYNATAATAELAYRVSAGPGWWVSWALNPVSDGMVGAQCLVATVGSDGKVAAYTSPVTSYATLLTEGQLSFKVSELAAVYADMEVIVFATLEVPGNKTKVSHVWQVGPMSSGGVPLSHVITGPNMRSSGTLNFLAQSSQGNGGDGKEESHNDNTTTTTIAPTANDHSCCSNSRIVFYLYMLLFVSFCLIKF